MIRINKTALTFMGLSIGSLLAPHLSFAVDTYDNKKTTTVEQTTTQTTTTAPKPVAHPVKKVAPVTTINSKTTTVTTKDGELRKVLDEDALKQMKDTICAEGFKAYVGNDKQNICQSKATVPDIAYSCVWDERGNAAYAPTEKGPCALDYSEHQASIVVTKSEFTASPPLPYGTEAQCCFRAAQGPATTTIETSPTTTAIVPKVK